MKIEYKIECPYKILFYGENFIETNKIIFYLESFRYSYEEDLSILVEWAFLTEFRCLISQKEGLGSFLGDYQLRNYTYECPIDFLTEKMGYYFEEESK